MNDSPLKTERATIVLNRMLLRKVRAVAKELNMSLSAFITLLIQEGLVTLEESRKAAYEFNPVTVKGTRLPSLNIANRDELFDKY